MEAVSVFAEGSVNAVCSTVELTDGELCTRGYRKHAFPFRLLIQMTIVNRRYPKIN